MIKIDEFIEFIREELIKLEGFPQQEPIIEYLFQYLNPPEVYSAIYVDNYSRAFSTSRYKSQIQASMKFLRYTPQEIKFGIEKAEQWIEVKFNLLDHRFEKIIFNRNEKKLNHDQILEEFNHIFEGFEEILQSRRILSVKNLNLVEQKALLLILNDNFVGKEKEFLANIITNDVSFKEFTEQPWDIKYPIQKLLVETGVISNYRCIGKSDSWYSISEWKFLYNSIYNGQPFINYLTIQIETGFPNVQDVDFGYKLIGRLLNESKDRDIKRNYIIDHLKANHVNASMDMIYGKYKKQLEKQLKPVNFSDSDQIQFLQADQYKIGFTFYYIKKNKWTLSRLVLGFIFTVLSIVFQNSVVGNGAVITLYGTLFVSEFNRIIHKN